MVLSEEQTIFKSEIPPSAPIGNYIADFCCIEEKLVIEGDGSRHQMQADADRVRTDFLKAKGYNVLRFLNNEVLANTKIVLEAIRMKLNKIPHPLPCGRSSPLKRGEEKQA